MRPRRRPSGRAQRCCCKWRKFHAWSTRGSRRTCRCWRRTARTFAAPVNARNEAGRGARGGSRGAGEAMIRFKGRAETGAHRPALTGMMLDTAFSSNCSLVHVQGYEPSKLSGQSPAGGREAAEGQASCIGSAWRELGQIAWRVRQKVPGPAAGPPAPHWPGTPPPGTPDATSLPRCLWGRAGWTGWRCKLKLTVQREEGLAVRRAAVVLRHALGGRPLHDEHEEVPCVLPGAGGGRPEKGEEGDDGDHEARFLEASAEIGTATAIGVRVASALPQWCALFVQVSRNAKAVLQCHARMTGARTPRCLLQGEHHHTAGPPKAHRSPPELRQRRGTVTSQRATSASLPQATVSTSPSSSGSRLDVFHA